MAAASASASTPRPNSPSAISTETVPPKRVTFSEVNECRTLEGTPLSEREIASIDRLECRRIEAALQRLEIFQPLTTHCKIEKAPTPPNLILFQEVMGIIYSILQRENPEEKREVFCELLEKFSPPFNDEASLDFAEETREYFTPYLFLLHQSIFRRVRSPFIALGGLEKTISYAPYIDKLLREIVADSVSITPESPLLLLSRLNDASNFCKKSPEASALLFKKTAPYLRRKLMLNTHLTKWLQSHPPHSMPIGYSHILELLRSLDSLEEHGFFSSLELLALLIQIHDSSSVLKNAEATPQSQAKAAFTLLIAAASTGNEYLSNYCITEVASTSNRMLLEFFVVANPSIGDEILPTFDLGTICRHHLTYPILPHQYYTEMHIDLVSKAFAAYSLIKSGAGGDYFQASYILFLLDEKLPFFSSRLTELGRTTFLSSIVSRNSLFVFLRCPQYTYALNKIISRGMTESDFAAIVSPIGETIYKTLLFLRSPFLFERFKEEGISALSDTATEVLEENVRLFSTSLAELPEELHTVFFAQFLLNLVDLLPNEESISFFFKSLSPGSEISIKKKEVGPLQELFLQIDSEEPSFSEMTSIFEVLSKDNYLVNLSPFSVSFIAITLKKLFEKQKEPQKTLLRDGIDRELFLEGKTTHKKLAEATLSFSLARSLAEKRKVYQEHFSREETPLQILLLIKDVSIHRPSRFVEWYIELLCKEMAEHRPIVEKFLAFKENWVYPFHYTTLRKLLSCFYDEAKRELKPSSSMRLLLQRIDTSVTQLEKRLIIELASSFLEESVSEFDEATLSKMRAKLSKRSSTCEKTAE